MLNARLRGNVGRAKELLDSLGINNGFIYLWRSPLVPSHEIIPKTDKLHQRQRGFTERLITYAIQIVFDTKSAKSVLDSYLLLLKRSGFAGLVTDNKLFTSKHLYGVDRRNLEEALVYCCYLLPDSDAAMDLCDIVVLHLRLCEKQDQKSHTLDSLERLSAQERDFIAI